MQYLYHSQAGASHLQLTGDMHRYLFKVRRHRVGETIGLRNLNDQILYDYHIDQLDKKMALLQKSGERELRIAAKQQLHIGWCIVDPKSIEKVLPILNEMGVRKITFIYCQRSQNGFRIDFDRFEKILLNSLQQCGRSEMMILDEVESLVLFLEANPNSWMLNFSDQILDTDVQHIKTLLIGAEGGFSEEECNMIETSKIVGLDTPLILRSESAVCAAVSKLLL